MSVMDIINYIIDIILKRRWLIILPLIIVLIGGCILSVLLPKMYQARTLILIQPQKVPTDYVRSLVTADITARINTISQQILSRSNLEKLIGEFKLFTGPEYKRMYIEDKIELLRKNISVEISSDKHRRNVAPDAFTLSYKGKEPKQVMLITNTLARYFIDENLKVREAQAMGTSSFLSDELDNKKTRLAQQEAALRKYRQKHMGGLPEQLETNLRVLDRLQVEQTEKRESLRNAKNRLISLDTALAEGQTSLKNSDNPSTNNQNVPKSDNELTLIKMEQELEVMLGKYTDRHPDVVRLKSAIANQKLIVEKEKASGTERTPQNASRLKAYQQRNETYHRLKLQRAETAFEIQSLELDLSKITKQIKKYQKRVEDTPKREQELLSLNRDYENIKETYNSILVRKLEAELAVNMEKKQKGEQFKIIDAAKKPNKPIEPDMKKLLLGTVFLGFAFGGGIVFLLEYLDTSFKNVNDLETFLGLTVLATIPQIVKPRIISLRLINNIFSVIGIGIAFGLMGVLALTTIIEHQRTIAFITNIINNLKV